ncbi:hypothetical protein EXIGLDRAFT_762097 [Exidia glandulosa HHB12029]|uniref:Nnf1-domain-containing protein n=1 Tax=Exidia glandulosa HHB12029 TaxID=1314781 RepID=A0A165MZU9_EXIGL|nr:hypothetical protein EXIGLDRAFT_762097 [Exidia glandulosa HHB12029]
MAEASEHTVGKSKRYINFVNAFQHTAQNATTRWTYDDVCACFPSYCAEASEQAAELRVDVGKMMAAQIAEHSQRYLDGYNAGSAIDSLHDAATTAKSRDLNSPPPKDAWRPNLEPRAVVRARIAPLLESEQQRMLQILQELEEENAELAAQLDTNNAAKAEADEAVTKMLDGLDKAVNKWSSLPLADIETWAIDALETQPLHSAWHGQLNAPQTDPQPTA